MWVTTWRQSTRLMTGGMNAPPRVRLADSGMKNYLAARLLPIGSRIRAEGSGQSSVAANVPRLWDTSCCGRPDPGRRMQPFISRPVRGFALYTCSTAPHSRNMRLR
jgi:hypothetical protein